MTLKKIVCPKCAGEGMILKSTKELAVCPKCKGKGSTTINKPDSFHGRKNEVC